MKVDVAGAREILVRGPNWLGDLVTTTPALRALRRAAPQARITLWVREALAPLLVGSSDVDCVVGLAPRPRGVRGLASALSAARALRRRGGYDLGLCLPDSFSSALLLRAAGARPLVGMANEARRLLLDVAVRDDSPPGRRVHEERWQALLRAIGVDAQGGALALAPTREQEAAADALLAGVPRQAERPLVALAPGAGFGPSKCWPAERFAAVGDALAADGAAIVLLGSSGEAALTARVRAAMAHTALDLGGRADVGVLAAIVRRLSLLVCNDAGARHLAAAFAVPSIVFFGPTSVARTPLHLEQVAVFERADDCRPCYLRACPIDHRCLAGITAAEVVPVARARLAERAERVGRAEREERAAEAAPRRDVACAAATGGGGGAATVGAGVLAARGVAR